MARALTPTKLTLDAFARYTGMNPIHFNQVRLDMNPHCDQIIFQYEWQNHDHVSREEIARAIAQAEANIERELKFHIAPTWDVDEWHEGAVPRDNRLHITNFSNLRGHRQMVQADWGYFISGGIEAKTLIEAGATITYTDADGDGYFETATVTVPTTVTNKNEIAIYYPGQDADDAWEIRDTKVVLSGSNAIITFRRELAVVPEITEATAIGEEPPAADGLNDDDFLEEVDVYRHWNDPQTQSIFLWEPLTNLCGICNGTGCDICGYTASTGCLILTSEPRRSNIGFWPSAWSADDEAFSAVSMCGFPGSLPDIVRLWYYSGWRNRRMPYDNRMDRDWEPIVAHYAASLLDRPPCDCATGDWFKWRQDVTIIGGDLDSKTSMPLFRSPTMYETNPLGTTRGAIEAWQKVRLHRRLESVPLP